MNKNLLRAFICCFKGAPFAVTTGKFKQKYLALLLVSLQVLNLY